MVHFNCTFRLIVFFVTRYLAIFSLTSLSSSVVSYVIFNYFLQDNPVVFVHQLSVTHLKDVGAYFK